MFPFGEYYANWVPGEANWTIGRSDFQPKVMKKDYLFQIGQIWLITNCFHYYAPWMIMETFNKKDARPYKIYPLIKILAVDEALRLW